MWGDVKGKETAGLGIRLAVRKGRRTHMSSWEPPSMWDLHLLVANLAQEEEGGQRESG